MRVYGGGSIQTYPVEDEAPHASGPEENWQESVVLIWWDRQHSLGGFHRIGHEPNYTTGATVAHWSYICTPDGVHNLSGTHAMKPGDRLPNGFGSGDGSSRCEFDSQCRWTLQADGLSVQLRVEDFHPSFYYLPEGSSMADFAPHHIDVFGRVVGSLTVKGKTYDVDGVCFRDHGWGPRDWSQMLSHRFIGGSVGPELSVCALAWHSSDDRYFSQAFVVRNDELIFARKIDILAYVECDGLTTRGGRVVLELADGEVLNIECEAAAPSLVSYHRGIICTDTMCKMTINGRIGYGDFETSNNFQAGSRKPGWLARGVTTPGWHPN